MKKILWTLFLLALLLMPLTQASAKAENGVEVNLIEPEVNQVNKGDTLTYRLDVKFIEKLNNFKNLFLTFRLDDSLDYVDSQIQGDLERPGAFETFSKENDQGRKGFMTLRLSDIDALNGKTSFSVNVSVKVNDRVKIGQKLDNQITASYQKQGQKNKADYFQFNQKSDFLIGKSNETKTEDKKPEEKKPEEKKPEEKPVIPIANPFLKIKTSPVYGEFMKEIEGLTNPEARIKVLFPDGEKEIAVDKSGKFTIPLNKKYTEDITINSLQGDKILNSITLKFVDENTMNDQYLNSIIASMKEFGDEELINRILADYKVYTDQMSIVIGLEGGTYQEMYHLFENLYLATRRGRSQETGNHKSFMQGYPDGTFLPGSSIKRSETAAILSRIIAGGEVGDKATSFEDVPSNEWYKKYIGHMEELGLMKGYAEDGTFRPDRKISRAEFASIVSRYLNLSQSQAINFPDLRADHWAFEDIKKVVAAGIMKGYEDGSFGPQKSVTRAEAATIINRVLKRYPDEDYIKNTKIKTFSDIKNHWAYYQIIEATYSHDYTIVNGVEKYN